MLTYPQQTVHFIKSSWCKPAIPWESSYNRKPVVEWQSIFYTPALAWVAIGCPYCRWRLSLAEAAVQPPPVSLWTCGCRWRGGRRGRRLRWHAGSCRCTCRTRSSWCSCWRPHRPRSGTWRGWFWWREGCSSGRPRRRRSTWACTSSSWRSRRRWTSPAGWTSWFCCTSFLSASEERRWGSRSAGPRRTPASARCRLLPQPQR